MARLAADGREVLRMVPPAPHQMWLDVVVDGGEGAVFGAVGTARPWRTDERTGRRIISAEQLLAECTTGRVRALPAPGNRRAGLGESLVYQPVVERILCGSLEAAQNRKRHGLSELAGETGEVAISTSVGPLRVRLEGE